MRPYIYLLYPLVFVLIACKNEKEKVKPQLGKLTESVYASVNVVPDQYYDAYSVASGILDEWIVEEGDTVKKNQAIAKISNTNPQLNIENALIAFNLAQENYTGASSPISVLKDQIQTAKKQLALDSLNFKRQESLWNQNVGSKSDYDNLKLKWDLSKDNLAVLNSRLNQTKLELKSAYQQSSNALAQAQSKLDDYVINSKIDGKIYDLLKTEGELVNQQQAIAQIGALDSFIIQLMVDEVDIALIQINQRVIVSLDAYKGEVFEASVSKIYPTKDKRTLSFKIDAYFTKKPERLYAGLAGEASIITGIQENAISIPYEYLLPNNQVLTKNGLVDVEIGISNMERVQIINGLDTSTYIMKPE